MEQAIKIIESLGFHDVESFLAEQQLSIETIQRRTNLPGQIIKSKLLEFQNKYLAHIIQPLSESKPSEHKNVFRLNNFFPKKPNYQTFWPQRIQMGQTYEVMGKANTGKTFFCYCLLEEVITSEKPVVLFDTANNFSPQKLAQWFGTQFTKKYKKFIKWFPVQTMKQLGQYLHFLGKKLKQQDIPSIIIIDSLSSLIQNVPFTENSSTFSAIRRQIQSLIDNTNSCVLFTTLSHSNLFQTAYTKNQQTRWKNIHAAMWDSLASNAIMLDSYLEVNQINGKIIRRTKMCLSKAAKENRMVDLTIQ